MREHPERPIFGPEDPRHDCDDEFIITNLSGANLSGADLEGANLVGADLGGAIADAETEWPEGFDPVAAGVIFD
jgi:hypothetical protein